MAKHSVNDDFSVSKCYAVFSHHGVYYGSTTQTMKERLRKHARDTLCSCYQLIQQGPFKYVSWPFPCESLFELEDEEAKYITTNWEDCVNKNIPGRVRRAGGMALYNKLPDRKARNNYLSRERIRKFGRKPPSAESIAKSVVVTQCECGGQYQHHNVLKHLQSRKHRAFADPSEVWLSPEKTVCKCGGMYRNSDKAKHCKTKKHLEFTGEMDSYVEHPREECECGGSYRASAKWQHCQSKMHKNFQANSLSSVPSS